jgi:DNA repair protein RadB
VIDLEVGRCDDDHGLGYGRGTLNPSPAGDRRVFITGRVDRPVSEALPTGCTAIDELLGGGIARGVVTQVYGPPAAGKTNLALSAAVEAAAGGQSVLYVDTEGLSIDRFEQLASARAEATDGNDSGPDPDPDPKEQGTDNRDEAGEAVEDLASRIVITDALDFAEQEEAVRDAAELAEQVSLVVLDSATGHYRLERSDEDEGETLRAVARQITHLLSLARKHDLAVLITNQVYTDPDADRVRPLGGHTLAHWSGVVLRVERFRGGQRRATLEKHESRPAGERARFRITDTGLEAVEDF